MVLDPNAQLFFACVSRLVAPVEQALNAGADIHHMDDEPLRTAAVYGRTEIVKLLLNHEPPADIHARDDEALREAASKGHAEVVRILLNHHDPANIHAGEDMALQMAAYYGHADVVELLLAEMSRLAQHAFSGGVSEDKCFTDGKISIAVRDACATQQFGTLVGTPLLVAKNFELFKRIWEALPEC